MYYVADDVFMWLCSMRCGMYYVADDVVCGYVANDVLCGM
jgi:hypothetical protein